MDTVNIDITKYIVDQALILVPALYVIGMILKNSVMNDKYIPLVLLGLGIIGAIALVGLSASAVIQGVLVTGATILINQTYKQLSSK